MGRYSRPRETIRVKEFVSILLVPHVKLTGSYLLLQKPRMELELQKLKLSKSY